MMAMDLSGRALRGIARYRSSSWHRRHQGCCRFSPSCSHYAEQALARRSLPVALLLVVWRVLRCNPLTPYGTVDNLAPRDPRRRRKVLSVLALAGLTTGIVAWTASAAAAAVPHLGGSLTAGGCNAFVGGVPVGNLDVDHPLQVHKHQRLVVTGTAPASASALGNNVKALTTIRVHFIEKLATRDFSEDSTGLRFQRSVNVDTYLKYGSGLYRVDVLSTSPGWNCSATFFVEMNGSKIIADAAILLGATGAVGVALSSRGGEPESLPNPGSDGLYDPGIAPDTLDQAQALDEEPDAYQLASIAGDGAWGCAMILIIFGLAKSNGDFGGFMALPVPARNRRIVWVKGHSVRGFFSGLLAGIGAVIACQQYALFPLTVWSAIIAPLVFAVLGGVRGRIGRAWKVG